MIISAAALSSDALQGIIEEFITRDGTDYGDSELTLEEKVSRLLPQVRDGQVLLVFDEQQQTVNLVHKQQFSEPGEK